MSEKQKVLLFSGAGYPAIQIIESMKHNMRFEMVAAGSYPNHSEFVCLNTVNDLPFVSDAEFIPKFRKLLEEQDISFVIPTDDTIAVVLMEHQKELPATIVCSPYETALLCRHKKMTYDALRGKFYVPEVYDHHQIDRIQKYPVFLKPDNSQGSRGAMVIRNREAFSRISDLQDMVICEYLPGEEYTVDCFTSREGNLLFCNPRVRTRTMNGITARGNTIPCTDEFRTVIEDINQSVKFRGYWFVQLKRDSDGRLKLLELCTRFAGSFGISNACGVNLPLLALCDFAGLPTDVIVNDYTVVADKTYIDRYRLDMAYRHVYIDYDDTVTSQKGQAVNPYVIAYLYQCRAKGIRITLITRHADTFGESLQASMERLGLFAGLFDEMIELAWNEKKEDSITDRKESIFIDNSFAERKAVHEKTGIPVFDVDNMDCLFDWRYA